MKILVTGSRGFIGAAIARRLKAAGHEVIGLVRRSDLAADELFLDLADPAPISAGALPAGVDAVVHSAAMMSSTRFSRAAMQVNAGGTQRLTTWAREAGVAHFVQVSSIGAYGLACVGEQRHEDTSLGWFPLLPAYLRSKARAERHVVAAGVPYTILRMPAVFGARDTVVTPAIVPSLLRGAMPWIRSRDRIVSTLWVENAAGVVAAVLARAPLQAALNVADGEVPWSQIVDTFGAALGVEVVWRKHGLHTLLTRSEDYVFQYMVTTGGFGAQFPTDRMHAALPGLALADWRDGVREAVQAYRADASSNQAAVSAKASSTP
ncbi:MAG TPA: NAD-dependent epimerase/dehydratase family protein [Nannocystaceae bacterium]|nr:NAD-dependent epimerase/dehydratase family protein [Nannocystaceae bacterium]